MHRVLGIWPFTSVLGLILIFVFSTPFRTQLLAGYPDDTIHHLSDLGFQTPGVLSDVFVGLGLQGLGLQGTGSIGLVLITVTLCVVFLYFCVLKARFTLRLLARLTDTNSRHDKLQYVATPMSIQLTIIGLIIDIATTLVLFWIALSVVPAIHYLYYQQLFEHLPNQWVVRGLLAWDDVVMSLQITDKASLAQHSSAVLFYCALFNSVCVALHQWRLIR